MAMFGPLCAIPPPQLLLIMRVGVPVRGRRSGHECDGSRPTSTNRSTSNENEARDTPNLLGAVACTQVITVNHETQLPPLEFDVPNDDFDAFFLAVLRQLDPIAGGSIRRS